MNPHEWGEIGIGGVLSAVATSIGAYFIKRTDRPKPPETLSVPQIETITKGLGELIDDLQAERRESREVIHTLRQELERLTVALSRAEQVNARLDQRLVGFEILMVECEQVIAAAGLPMPALRRASSHPDRTPFTAPE